MRTTLLGVVLIALSAIAFARQADGPKESGEKDKAEATVNVVAEGVGTTADDALKDAFRNAVRQVVGAVVDAETLVKNDEVISDKVLTYSDGFVKKYKEVSSKRDKGLYRVKINATVERRSVVAKLKEAKVTLKDYEGKDDAAKALTVKEARENATALVEKILRELPPLLTAESSGKPSFDTDSSEVVVKVEVKVDEARYASFTKRFADLLEKVKIAGDSAHLVAEEVNDRERGDVRSNPLRFPEFEAKVGDLAGPRLPASSKKAWCVWLLPSVTKVPLRCRWNAYVVDADYLKCLPQLAGKTRINVALLNAKKEVIIEDEFLLYGEEGPNRVRLRRGSRDGFAIEDEIEDTDDFTQYDRTPRVLFQAQTRDAQVVTRSTDVTSYNLYVAPLVFSVGRRWSYDDRGTTIQYSRTLTLQRKIKVPEEELKQVKQVRCSVIFRPAKHKSED